MPAALPCGGSRCCPFMTDSYARVRDAAHFSVRPNTRHCHVGSAFFVVRFRAHPLRRFAGNIGPLEAVQGEIDGNSMRTLVLNAGFEPLAVVSFKRALVLVLNQKATVLAHDAEHPVWSM